MNLSLSEDQMRAVVAKAILEGLGDEQKTLIIAKALEGLLGPASRDHYSSDKRSKLEVAFDTAAEQALLVVAREELAKPESREKLRGLTQVALEKLFDPQNTQGLTDRLAIAMANAFTKD